MSRSGSVSRSAKRACGPGNSPPRRKTGPNLATGPFFSRIRPLLSGRIREFCMPRYRIRFAAMRKNASPDPGKGFGIIDFRRTHTRFGHRYCKFRIFAYLCGVGEIRVAPEPPAPAENKAGANIQQTFAAVRTLCEVASLNSNSSTGRRLFCLRESRIVLEAMRLFHAGVRP